jgi:hypothetical protein
LHDLPYSSLAHPVADEAAVHDHARADIYEQIKHWVAIARQRRFAELAQLLEERP